MPVTLGVLLRRLDHPFDDRTQFFLVLLVQRPELRGLIAVSVSVFMSTSADLASGRGSRDDLLGRRLLTLGAASADQAGKVMTSLSAMRPVFMDCLRNEEIQSKAQ